MARRVVITGIGLLSALGNNVKDTWEGIKNGKSGLGMITRFDTTNYQVKVAAELKNFDPADYVDPKEIRRSDPYQHFIYPAAKEAIAASGFEVTPENTHRSSVVIGSAVGGMKSYWDNAELIMQTDNPRKVTPFGVPMLMANGGSDRISIMVGAMGPSCTMVSACATGGDCIGYAFDLIRFGRVDQALAGASDYAVMPLGIAAFDRIGACSRDPNPETALRPFDKGRQGFVFGEGCGVLVLEELEFAKKRGANILAELVGYGSTSDAVHLTAPDPEAVGAIAAMRHALADAKMNVEDIDYINAHGTGTSLNDETETLAVKTVFGAQAYNVAVSSTKSMTGHAMGATAAMEASFAVLAIQDQIAPPTINYETPDPELDLDYVPNVAREMPIKAVMSNAFGFGGHNVSLIIKAFE